MTICSVILLKPMWCNNMCRVTDTAPPHLRPPQDYPDVSKQPEWNVKVKADAVDWKATIDEALERGKAVPEVEWCIPGEKAALQASQIV